VEKKKGKKKKKKNKFKGVFSTTKISYEEHTPARKKKNPTNKAFNEKIFAFFQNYTYCPEKRGITTKLTTKKTREKNFFMN